MRIIIIMLTILVLLFGFVISQQQIKINELENRMDIKTANDKIIYKYMIRHEASIRLLKNR